MNDTEINYSELAGRLIMVRLFGTELDADTDAFLRQYKVRGACLFRQNMMDAAQLTRFTGALRDAMGTEALIALDQEGGAVVRSTWVPAPPSAMALGAANDTQLAREVGAAVARAVRALGFNWNFAPVLDLNNNPHNPVIAERSFGADPETATRIAMAWMEGSEGEGVACCVKHFPGHGDTHVDSHRDLPLVDKPLAELERFEFAPFRIAAPEASAVMTAHIVYPALDPKYPATMSRPILTGILRERFGFDGVIITDGMDMHAIAHRYGAGEAAVNALVAGADMVMAIGSRETQIETVHAIAAAIRDGVLPLAEVEARLARLAKLAAAHPAGPVNYMTDVDDRALMARAWRAGLTALGQPQRPERGARIRLVARADVVSDGVSEAGVPAAAIAAALGRLYEVDLVTFLDAETFDWSALPQDGRFTILASTSRRRYGPHARATWLPDLHVALWNPYQALDFGAPALMTYGFAAPALDAVIAWLAGEIDAPGNCPVPGFGGAP
ncbi:beta-N-acetylhexosaminidase [Massilia sp. BSC265]|uniref:beta-N-acetylhexosaminidase n=1 Tax=Massilia sp. BSC265 TaxID=1549812 RepID=UPI0004E9558E|nr:beta-N-acetylhexosaminidase [Massilia sp. BSC265]KFI05503.1 beta-N-acetylhexosaminidase [Massilia sp. BSC265]